jgi:hypothetical protein
MIKVFFGSNKWFGWAYGSGVLLLGCLYAQVYMTVLGSRWRRSFFDMFEQIEEHTLSEFWASLGRFTWIVAGYVFFAVLTAYLTRLYSLCWREAMTFAYIPRWREVREEIEGSSQRIQEDTYRFAKIVESLGLQVNWLRVLDAAERPQMDQGRGHQLHPIVSLLDAFQAEQSPLELVLPRKGPLNAHASRMDGGVDEPLAPPLGARAVARLLWDVRAHPRVDNALPRRSGVKPALAIDRSPSAGPPTSGATGFRACKLLGNKTMSDSLPGATGRGAST